MKKGEEVYGFFLTPGRNYMGQDNILYCNTLSSLLALEKFNKAEQIYKMTWPDSTERKMNVLPFEISHFVSQDKNDGNQVKTLTGLYKIAGLWMFLNIFGLKEKRVTRLTDSKGSAFIDKYGTFGISAVQYPKRQLEELISIDLSINLLKRWIDPIAYYNKGTKTEIKTVKQKIINESINYFEVAIKSAFDMLNATLVDGENRILSDLAIKTEQINKKDHNEQSDYHFIKKWFSSNGENNYYTAIKNNLKLAEDDLIQKIYEHINNTLNKSENLQIAKIQLNTIVDSINNCTSYWGSMGISPKPEKWENLLEKQIRWILKKRYRIIGEQNTVVYDRLRTTFELMKIHLMEERIVALRNNINDKTDAIKTFNGDYTLPKIHTIDEVIKQISNCISSNDRNNSISHITKTLQSRYDDITAELNDTSIPILRVYKDGSSEEAFKRSYSSAISRYYQKVGRNITSKVTVIGEQSLWNYLNMSPSKFYTTLINDCILRFETDIRQYESIDNLDVAKYIAEHPSDCGKMALIAKEPFIMVNNDDKTEFVKAKGIPRLIIGKNKNQIDRVFDSLTNSTEISYLHSYTNDEDGIWLNEEINNIVIFYVEQGFMSNGETFNPLKHMEHINDIKRVYESEAERFTGIKNTDEKVWHKLRCPYLSYEEKIAFKP